MRLTKLSEQPEELALLSRPEAHWRTAVWGFGCDRLHVNKIRAF